MSRCENATAFQAGCHNTESEIGVALAGQLLLGKYLGALTLPFSIFVIAAPDLQNVAVDHDDDDNNIGENDETSLLPLHITQSYKPIKTSLSAYNKIPDKNNRLQSLRLYKH